ncbi:hypothetical protein DF010_33605 [Burkholderia cenocepacia]|nr:hypothetical protein DF040_23310 [Burkholderia cenocepacia]RQV67506.1 hypothetical protein DF010_33605 [Burkholderia cenocepacia]
MRERHGFGEPQERPGVQFRGQCGAQRMVHHRFTTLPCSVPHAGLARPDRRATLGRNASVIALWQTHSNNKNA